MIRWGIALLISVLLLGCATNTAGLNIDGETRNVFFHDNVLASRLVVTNVIKTEVNGHTKAVVGLQSEYRADLHILYRFYWYDDQGLEVSRPGPWLQGIVKGFEPVQISATSVSPDGKQFRVQIREAQD